MKLLAILSIFAGLAVMWILVIRRLRPSGQPQPPSAQQGKERLVGMVMAHRAGLIIRSRRRHGRGPPPPSSDQD